MNQTIKRLFLPILFSVLLIGKIFADNYTVNPLPRIIDNKGDSGLYNEGDITIEAYSATEDTTITVLNSDTTYESNVDVEGDLSFNNLFTGTSLNIGPDVLTANLVGYTGKVGIGTTTPSEAVDLAAGNLTTTGKVSAGNTYPAVLGDEANTRSGYFADEVGTVAIADNTCGIDVQGAGGYGAAGNFVNTQTVALCDNTYAINATGDMSLSGVIKNAGFTVIDLPNYQLWGGGEILAIDWDARTLNDLSGDAEAVLNWTTPNLADFLDSDITTTGTVYTGSILAGTDTSGVLTLGGTGGTYDENLTFDFDYYTNEVYLSSSSGTDRLIFGIMFQVLDDTDILLGGGNDVALRYNVTQAKDSLQLGLRVGNNDFSGYFSIMEKIDLGVVNRSPLATTANPTLRIYSADATVATDYIEFFHNQTDAYIQSGTGTINLNDDSLTTTGNIYIDSDSSTIGFGVGSPTPEATIGYSSNALNIIANVVNGTDSLNLNNDWTVSGADGSLAASNGYNITTNGDISGGTFKGNFYSDTTGANSWSWGSNLVTPASNIEFNGYDIFLNSNDKLILGYPIYELASDGTDMTITDAVSGLRFTLDSSGDYNFAAGNLTTTGIGTLGNGSKITGTGGREIVVEEETIITGYPLMMMNGDDGSSGIGFGFGGGLFLFGKTGGIGGNNPALWFIDRVNPDTINSDITQTLAGNLNFNADSGLCTFSNITAGGLLTVPKINPTATQDLNLFGDTDIDPALTGKKLIVHRKSSEGDSRIEIFMHAAELGVIAFTGDAGEQFFIDNNVGELWLQSVGVADVTFFANAAANRAIKQYGDVNGTNRYMSWTLKETDDYFWLEKSHADVLGFKIDMPVVVGVDDAGHDVKFYGTTAGASMLWDESEDTLFIGTIRAHTSVFRRYYHLPMSSFAPGLSGATWTPATANNLCGWHLDVSTELLETNVDVHSDWDGATDMEVQVYFTVNDATTANGNTVDLQLVSYYTGVGDVTPKTQTQEIATTTDGTQWKVYSVDFTINWDETNNVVEVGDQMCFTLNMQTGTSEVDTVIINSATFDYPTTHIGIEDTDI